jgi:hypothetical protein
MGDWLPWFKHTGDRVRHKKTGATGEIVFRHPNNGDCDVRLDNGGTIVCWLGSNMERVPNKSEET